MFTSGIAGFADKPHSIVTMRTLGLAGILTGFLFGPLFAFAATPTEQPTVIIVVGAPGEEEFGQSFAQSAGLLEKAARKADAKELVIGLQTTNATPDHDLLQQAFASEAKEGAA